VVQVTRPDAPTVVGKIIKIKAPRIRDLEAAQSLLQAGVGPARCTRAGWAIKALTMGRPAPPEHGDQWIDNRARKAQDEAFCDALAYAWKQGLENPPMIGIDSRPCTANPVYVPRREQQPPGQSIGSELN
jgi:hypothetical protein